MPFTVRVLDMEQGDCTLIKCPDDRLVMVDCGSKSGFSDDRMVVAQMSARDWAIANGNKIDALILTHPDKDHYSQVFNVLGRFEWDNDVQVGNEVYRAGRLNKVKLPNIYFSLASNVAGPLANYSTNSINHYIYTEYFNTSLIHEVTINAATQSYITWDYTDKFTAPSPATAIANHKYTILNGVESGTNWSVSIIAGNVPPPGGAAGEEAKNHYSLVTLLEHGANKGLIMGDSTMTTEAFLALTHAAAITNVVFIQAGHHGSETSSGTIFAATTNPSVVYISVENTEHSHFLPKFDRVSEWLTALNGKPVIADHTIDYWVRDPNAMPGMANLATAMLDAWKLDATIHVYPVPPEVASYYFLDPDFHDYSALDNQYFALHTKTGFRLYRAGTTRNLRETATQGSFEFTLG